jgi:hypothetical protein
MPGTFFLTVPRSVDCSANAHAFVAASINGALEERIVLRRTAELRLPSVSENQFCRCEDLVSVDLT